MSEWVKVHLHPAEVSPKASSKVDSPSLKNRTEPWLVLWWLECTQVVMIRMSVTIGAPILEHCSCLPVYS